MKRNIEEDLCIGRNIGWREREKKSFFSSTRKMVKDGPKYAKDGANSCGAQSRWQKQVWSKLARIPHGEFYFQSSLLNTVNGVGDSLS
jgi:hypothetical protein